MTYLDEVPDPVRDALWLEAKNKGHEVVHKLVDHNLQRIVRTTGTVGEINRWHEARDRALRRLGDLRLVCTNRKSRVAGRAKIDRGYDRDEDRVYENPVVEINCWLIEDEAEFRDTLLHEVAHHVVSALFPQAVAHGREWQHVAAAMGADPRAVGKGLSAEKAKQLRRGQHYIGTCENGHRIHIGPKFYKQWLADPMRLRCPKDYTQLKTMESDA